MNRAACHGSEHPPPPPDRPLAARGPGRKPWHILGENGWRILTENLHLDRPDRSSRRARTTRFWRTASPPVCPTGYLDGEAEGFTGRTGGTTLDGCDAADLLE